jgi:peptide/nickel transport system ATP-binding protein
VLYAGQIAEIGKTRDLIKSPKHPYTSGLMNSIPSMDHDEDRLIQIPGSMPRLTAIPPGCSFHPRCTKAFAPCMTKRASLIGVGDVDVACWLFGAEAEND